MLGTRFLLVAYCTFMMVVLQPTVQKMLEHCSKNLTAKEPARQHAYLTLAALFHCVCIHYMQRHKLFSDLVSSSQVKQHLTRMDADTCLLCTQPSLLHALWGIDRLDHYFKGVLQDTTHVLCDAGSSAETRDAALRLLISFAVAAKIHQNILLHYFRANGVFPTLIKVRCRDQSYFAK